MPPALPDRYQLEVRLGRDGDVEEWLAMDTALDRPVLVRALGPEAGPERSEQFLEAVRGAAQVSHIHLAAIYTAAHLEDSTYSISEWVGGMTLADRTAAREPIPPEEFVPNAAGLAEALAVLHAAGQIHGAIDARAIFFSAAHPAKLAAFGRPPVTRYASDDVEALATTLERTLTGGEPGNVPPSQVVDRLSPIVDGAMSEARTGMFDAGALASALHTAPTPNMAAAPAGEGWNWKWLAPAAFLALVAIVLTAIGVSLVDDGGRAAAVPTPTTSPSPTPPPVSSPPSESEPPQTSDGPPVTVVRAFSFDPTGDGEEHEELAAAAIDGDFATSWKTESYLDPLPLQKAGVGLAVEVDGSPSGVDITGIRNGTVWELRWSPAAAAALADWTGVAEGTVRDGQLSADLPEQAGGVWLIWFTDLPADNEGTYNSTVAEVRFRP